MRETLAFSRHPHLLFCDFVGGNSSFLQGQSLTYHNARSDEREPDDHECGHNFVQEHNGEQNTEDAFGGKQQRRRGGRHVRKADVLQRERKAGREQCQIQNAAQQLQVGKRPAIEWAVDCERDG